MAVMDILIELRYSKGTCCIKRQSPGKKLQCRLVLCDAGWRDNVADLNQEDGLLTMRTTAEASGVHSEAGSLSTGSPLRQCRDRRIDLATSGACSARSATAACVNC